MGIINRLLLLPYTLVAMALSIAVVALALRIVPEGIWLNEVRFARSVWCILLGQPQAVLCGVFAYIEHGADTWRIHGG